MAGMWLWSIHGVKGSAHTTETRMTPTRVLMRPRFFRRMNTGMTIRTKGNTWLTRIHPILTVRPLLRLLARTYDAGAEISVVMIAVAVATMNELRKAKN